MVKESNGRNAVKLKIWSNFSFMFERVSMQEYLVLSPHAFEEGAAKEVIKGKNCLLHGPMPANI